MKKVTIYNTLFAPNPQQNQQTLQSVLKTKQSNNSTTWFEHYTLLALLAQPNIEKIELEADCGKNKRSTRKLRSDFRITFTDGTVRRVEANGSWHFFGMDNDTPDEYLIQWSHLIDKQVYCEKNSEPCLNINDLVNKSYKGFKNKFSFAKQNAVNTELMQLGTNPIFIQAINNLKTSTKNLQLNLCMKSNVIITKSTTNSKINTFITQMVNNPHFRIWIP